GRGRRARSGVEQAELAEHLTRPEDRQEVLPAVRARPAELDLALADHVQRLAGVALGEELVAPLQVGAVHRGAQGGRGLLVQPREGGARPHDGRVPARSLPQGRPRWTGTVSGRPYPVAVATTAKASSSRSSSATAKAAAAKAAARVATQLQRQRAKRWAAV